MKIIEKFSSSYTNTNSNFVIINNHGDYNMESPYYPYYCVVSNLLQRGRLIKPSDYLQDQIPYHSNTVEQYVYDDEYEPSWSATIKGGTYNNPALNFYNNIESFFHENYHWIKQFIIPEFPIVDILNKEDKNEFINQDVDFFIPDLKTIIEIDGYSHHRDGQSIKDRKRDSYLSKAGFNTFRIDTKDLREKNNKLYKILTEIQKKAVKVAKNKKITSIKKIEKDSLIAINLKYETILRIQILLIELLKKSVITIDQKTWTFNIISELEEIDKLFRIATRDLFLWFKNLFKLTNIQFKAPKIIFDKYSELTIDISVMKPWSERETEIDTIYIRNEFSANLDYFNVGTSKKRIPYCININSNEKQRDSLLFFLYNLFGYTTFNPGQIEIIQHVLNGHGTLGILPTGSGKSLCYQLAGILQPRINIVVIPTVSLIHDQKKELDKYNITRTGIIAGIQKKEHKFQILKEFGDGRYFFIWISPERFQNTEFRDTLLGLSNNGYEFGLGVIDEIHCLSEWGHDFRTSYLTLIKTMNSKCNDIQLLGLTATASQVVAKNLINELGIKKEDVITPNDIDRPELHYRVIEVKDETSRKNKLVKILNNHHGNYRSGIIFTLTVKGDKGCKEISNFVKKKTNICTDNYYGDKNDKQRTQDQFNDNKFPLLCATKSFGMGINKTNVDLTIHYGLPWSIESFYQESGRAGREGQNSYCYIINAIGSNNEKLLSNVFSKKTSILDIKRNLNFITGDLNTLMFLWTQSNIDPWIERLAIMHIYNHLNNSEIISEPDIFKIKKDIILELNKNNTKDKQTNKESIINNSVFNINFEKILHKLYILGIITDWTNTFYPKIHYVDKTDIDIEEMEKNVVDYIMQYDTDFSFDDKEYFYCTKEYIKKKTFNNLVDFLLIWNNSQIIYTRKSAIANMYKMCQEKREDTQIREYINSFFALDSSFIKPLDKIIEYPYVYNNWIEIFFEYPDGDFTNHDRKKEILPKDKLKELSAQCDRYMESFQHSLGLRAVNTFSKMMLNDITEDNFCNQITKILESFTDKGKLIPDVFINGSLDILSNQPEEYKMAFGAAIVEVAPEESFKVYKKLGDNFTLEFLINLYRTSLDNITEDYKNGTKS